MPSRHKGELLSPAAFISRYNDARKLKKYQKEGGLKPLPIGWQGALEGEDEEADPNIPELENVWYHFFIGTLKRTERKLKEIYKIVLPCYALTLLLMDILRCMWTRRMGAPSTFLRGAVRLCILHAVVASLGYAAMRTIDDSNWAKDIAASRAFQLPELDVVVDTEGHHVTRAVLPTESDILIVPEYADDKLAGYGRVLDYAHPGNVMWNDLTRSYGRGYVQLSDELQHHFCRSLLAFVQQSSRFLKQGSEREFLPIEDDGELYYLCHRDLVAATDKKVFAMIRQLDSLRTVAKLGRFANTAMQATYSPQYLAYWEKILTPLRRWKPRMELSNDVSRTILTPRLLIRSPPKSEYATTWKIGSSIPKSGAPKEPFPLAWIREGDVVEAMYRCSSNCKYHGTYTLLFTPYIIGIKLSYTTSSFHCSLLSRHGHGGRCLRGDF